MTRSDDWWVTPGLLMVSRAQAEDAAAIEGITVDEFLTRAGAVIWKPDRTTINPETLAACEEAAKR